MILTVIGNLLLWLGTSAPVVSWAATDGLVEGAPKRFDCRVRDGQYQLDILFSEDPSSRPTALHSSTYHLTSSMEADYLSCHRVLAMAEAYNVGVSYNAKTGQMSALLDVNQSSTILPAKPELLACQILPEGSNWPNTVTIQYGDHVIYRDYSLTGWNRWKEWTQDCEQAKEKARALGGHVQVNLTTWTFSAVGP